MAGKKQHYVPQFLLRNFSLRGTEGRLSAYRIAEGKFLSSQEVRNLALENNFYGSPALEDELARMEGEASAVIRDAIASESLPPYRSDAHRALFVFVMTQAFRTRGSADETSEMVESVLKRALSGVPQVRAHLEDVRIRLTNAPQFTLGTATAGFPLAADLRYKLLCNRTPKPFVTSDHPAVRYNQFLEARHPEGGNTGIAAKGLQVFLPVGPRHAVLFFDADVYTVGGRRLTSQRVEVDRPADVAALNLLQAVSATNALYFGDGFTPRDAEGLCAKASKWRSRRGPRTAARRVVVGPARLPAEVTYNCTDDVRTRLALSCVRQTPQSQRYDVSHSLAHLRNPGWCAVYQQFLEAVWAERYTVEQFDQFVADRQREGVR